MLDEFREWLSDNLRYILLGLAVLVVLLVIVSGVKALNTGLFDNKKEETDTKTEQPEDSNTSDDEPEAATSEENVLEENAYPEVNALIEAYYAAWGQKDVAKMKELINSFSATDEAKVTNAAYIEGYNNLTVYTKKGLTEDSYVAFVCYDLKFKDVETAAPGLTVLYVVKNQDGKYLIQNSDGAGDIEACINQARQDPDVLELIAQVEEKLNAAMASDDTLRAFEEQLGEETNTALMADNGDMLTAAEACNVRADSTTNAEILGQLKPGDQVKKLENSVDNWIKVEYEGREAYVYGDLLR